jgi:hypothetical protein
MLWTGHGHPGNAEAGKGALMQSRQRSVSVIVVPADERQPPGWFAMHPDQYTSDAERNVAHGRWHCLSSQGARIYRALQFRSDLPVNGLALDWQARTVLGVEPRGAIAECKPVTLNLRPARLSEYPRCVWGHPSPVVRLASRAATAFLLIVLLVVAGLGSQWHRATTTVPAAGPAPWLPDAAAFLHTVAGEWRTSDELLVIRDDKGVVEIIRQTQAADGGKQLDFHAAAPVQFDVVLNQIELDTQAGRWLLKLVPDVRRTRMVITYPDQRQVVYE